MNIAITGASGFLGRHLVDAFTEKGYLVYVLTRNKHAFTENDKISCVVGDIEDPDAVEKLVANSDIVCNFAGTYSEQSEMEAINYNVVKALYKSSADSGVKKFIQLSSVGVYGYKSSGMIDEDSQFNPNNLYEETKAHADKWLLSQNHGDLELCIVRPSIVFGADMKNSSLRELVNAIVSKKFFFIGKKGASANYIHVKSVADAIVLLASSSQTKHSVVYNISDYMSQEHFVALICNHYGVKYPMLRLPKLMVYSAAAILDAVSTITGVKFPLTRNRVLSLTSKARYDSGLIYKETGYKNTVDLEKGIMQVLSKWDIDC